MKFDQLVRTSGDSELINYIYKNGTLTLVLEHEELDAEVTINIKTTAFKIDEGIDNNGLEKLCRIEISYLKENLEEQNSYFVASNSFPAFISELKTNLSLGYGIKVNEKACVLSLIGYSRIISCLVMNIDEDISYTAI